MSESIEIDQAYDEISERKEGATDHVYDGLSKRKEVATAKNMAPGKSGGYVAVKRVRCLIGLLVVVAACCIGLAVVIVRQHVMADTNEKPTNGDSARGCYPEIWTKFQGSCYLSFPEYLNFTDAEDKCKEQGGRLVHIETALENVFLKNFVMDYTTIARHWIGLEDKVVDDIWKWTGTDTITNFTDWYPSEPNQGTVANCAAISIERDCQWIDDDCSVVNRPLCEKMQD